MKNSASRSRKPRGAVRFRRQPVRVGAEVAECDDVDVPPPSRQDRCALEVQCFHRLPSVASSSRGAVAATMRPCRSHRHRVRCPAAPRRRRRTQRHGFRLRIGESEPLLQDIHASHRLQRQRAASAPRLCAVRLDQDAQREDIADATRGHEVGDHVECPADKAHPARDRPRESAAHADPVEREIAHAHVDGVHLPRQLEAPQGGADPGHSRTMMRCAHCTLNASGGSPDEERL